MVVQSFDERGPLLGFSDEPPVFLVEIHFLSLDPRHVVFKLADLVDFALAAVPSSDLYYEFK